MYIYIYIMSYSVYPVMPFFWSLHRSHFSPPLSRRLLWPTASLRSPGGAKSPRADGVFDRHTYGDDMVIDMVTIW